MFTLKLIRHGRTEANERNIFGGSHDFLVTEGGFQELSEKMADGRYTKNDAYYTSKLTRTHQTLKHLYGDVPFTQIGELNEVDLGQTSLKSRHEVANDPNFKAWAADKTGDYRLYDAETYNEFRARINIGMAKVIDDVIKNKYTKVALILHAGVINTIMRETFSDYLNEYHTVDNGCGYVLEFKDGKFVSFEEFS